MFTQQAPFLLSALSPAVGSTTAQQLAQAFGNCNQPLSHRAGVSLQRAGLPTNAGVLRGPGGNPYDYTAGTFGFLAGNDPATQFSPWAFDRGNFYGGDTFNTSLQFAFRSGAQFLATYPAAASNAFYNLSQSFEFGPVSSVNNSPWYTRMGDINSFDFSSRLGDIVNNFAGPTFQVAGDSYFDNSVHNNMTSFSQTVNAQTVENAEVNNLVVRNLRFIGGDPAFGVGPAGPAGEAGDPAFGGGPGGPAGAFGFAAGYDLPAIQVVGNRAGPVRPEGKVEWPVGKDKIQIPTYKLPPTLKVKFPAVEFDAENCTVSYSTEDTVELDLEVTLADMTLQEAAAKKDIPLPVPVFKGQNLPTLNLGPQGLNLVPKPRFP